MSKTTQCACNPCPGASCQCGCQNPQAKHSKTTCQCGASCQCGPACARKRS